MMRVALFTGQDIGYILTEFLASRPDVELKVFTYETESDRANGYRSSIQLCENNKIHCTVVDKVTDSLVSDVAAFKPDFLVSAYFAKLFPQSLIDLPRHGSVNIHPGKLPSYRGGFPTAWALVHGETEFGVTIHQLDAGTDTGDILVQHTYPIEPDETGFELYRRSMSLGAQMFVQTFDDIVSGRLEPRKQEGPGSYFGTFPRRHELSWKNPRRWIRNQIRAHALPYYPAFSFLGNKCVLFHRVSLLDVPGFQAQGPGRIIEVREGGTFVVTCADGCLLVEDCSIVPLADRAPIASYFRPNQRFEFGGGL